MSRLGHDRPVPPSSAEPGARSGGQTQGLEEGRERARNQSGLMKTFRNCTRLEAGDQVPSGFFPP